MTAPTPDRWRLDHRGFTLIEILATIIISAILTVILAQVISEQTWRSYQPVQTLDDTLALNAVMNNIVADYRHLQHDPVQADPLTTLRQRLESGAYWQHGAVVAPSTAITVATRCVRFEPPGGTAAEVTCSVPFQDLLQVTLSLSDTSQNLTALFGP